YLALHPDPASVQLDELPGERQSQSRTLHFPVRGPDLPEFLEHCLLILGRDADPGVADRHLNGFAYRFRPDLDATTLRRELDLVGEQIEEDLADLSLVGLDLAEALVAAPVQLDPSAPRPLANEHQRIVDGHGQIEVRHFEPHLPRLDLRQIEDVID